jgi:restriction system protein
MAENDVTLWGIHAGRNGEADQLFLKKNCVAIGWIEMGDLSKITPNRDAFKEKAAQVYHHSKPGAIPVYAGVAYRFAHEMKPGDLVAYPSKLDREIHIGRIEGDYEYNPRIDTRYPNLRRAKWLKAVPRTRFTQGALYEIGSAVTLFQVKTYADEFRAALEGQAAAPPLEHDATIVAVSQDVEQNTRDFILKQLAQEFKGHPLAEFVGHLLNQMGYRTRVSPPGPDTGVDIIAHKDELGFEPPIIKVQVKSTEGSIGNEIVSALSGTLGAGEYGLLVTLGTFSNPAKNFARGKSNLRLVDGDELVDLILQHYEDFDSRYKGLLPLKRVYVPQPIEEAEA